MLLSNIYRKAAEILDAGRSGAYTPEYAMLVLRRNRIDRRTHGAQLDGMAEYAIGGDRWGLSKETQDPFDKRRERQARVLGLLLLSEIARDAERKWGRK